MIGSRGLVEDEAITGVLRLYIEGSANGDSTKLRQAFHEHARTYGSLNGTRYDLAVAEMIAMEERAPRNSDGRYTAHIMSIEQAGDVARATVEEDGCWGTASFTSFFSLVRFDDRWQIVARVFAHVSGALPS
ncbi:MAG TPA: nuclear transport factor 2 family protein [Gaiellaceae bacterium]|nr:nuclear transport factor 2 family protein [Gaiellaceae bacterium]